MSDVVEHGPPALVEHTDEILERLGVSGAERERLREADVVE